MLSSRTTTTAQKHLTAHEIRQQMAGDIHRPRYHFLPPSNWMNDPNGLIQWNGKYHLFYQHNPFGPFHANIHWGHAVSDNLVHWHDFPIALAPTPDGPDKDGCWSGCAVDHDGIPTLLYTGARPETQCVATGSPDLLAWNKYAGNPVIPGPPNNLELTGFRDPCVWREADAWYMLIGSGIKGVGGTTLLYRSPDLLDWEYMHPLYLGDQNETADMWECPSFFPLGDKYVLLISVIQYNRVLYFTGTYRNHKFEPDYQGRLDQTALFYAPQSFLDSTGRRLILGWIPEARSSALVKAAGWAGIQSVPRVLSLRPDGRLGIDPVPELETLRGQHTGVSCLTLSPGTANPLAEVQGNRLELIIEFEQGSAGQYGVKLLRSPGGEEETTIVYDRTAQTLTLDRARSCTSPEGIDITPQSGSLELIEDESLRLHIFLDHSVIEVFANGHMALTSRVYPTRHDSLGLELSARAGTVRVKQVDVWQLGSIW